MGIIDQWGNGLKLISDELEQYPEIEFKWFEKGLQFQVQFVKSGQKRGHADVSKAENNGVDKVAEIVGAKLALSWHQAGTK